MAVLQGADLVSGTIDVGALFTVTPVDAWVTIPMDSSYALLNNTKYAVQVRATGGPGYTFGIGAGAITVGRNGLPN